MKAEKKLRGTFLLNGLTGLTRLVSEDFSLDSFKALDIRWKAREMFARVARFWGETCYENFLAKPVTAKPRAMHAEIKVADNPENFKPAVIEASPEGFEIPVDEEKLGHDAIPDEAPGTEHGARTITVNVLSWARRGCWATSRTGHRYWRKGTVCHRHVS